MSAVVSEMGSGMDSRGMNSRVAILAGMPVMKPTGKADGRAAAKEKRKKIKFRETGVLLVSILCRTAGIFVDALVGRIQWLMTRDPEAAKNISADAAGQVLRALISHQGWHSNRVWSSIPRLCELTKLSKAQVQRVLAYFTKMEFIKVVKQDDLTNGPGPQQFPRDKRRKPDPKNDDWKGPLRDEGEKKLDANCYDLSGFLMLFTAEMRQMFTDIINGSVQISPEQSGLSPAQVIEDAFDDPFADPLAPSISASEDAISIPLIDIETSHTAPSTAIPINSGSKNTDSDSDVCNVVYIDKPTGKQTNAPTLPSPEYPFLAPKMIRVKTRTRTRGDRPENQANSLTDKDTPFDRACLALGEVDVDIPVRRRIVTAMGIDNATTLVWYGRWRRIVGDADGKPIRELGAYLYETWRTMEDLKRENGRDYYEWPDDFLPWLAKEKKIAAEAAQNHADAVSARSVATNPVVPVTPTSEVDTAFAGSFAACEQGDRSSGFSPSSIPEAIRSEVLALAVAAALEEVQNDAYTLPSMKRKLRASIERMEDRHPMVRKSAERIWKEWQSVNFPASIKQS